MKIIEWIIKYMNKTLYGEIHYIIENKANYLNFQNSAEAREWGTKYYSQWGNKYKSTMRVAQNVVYPSSCTNVIEYYCGYSYSQINQYLRIQDKYKFGKYKEMADILCMVLCFAPRIPSDIVVYRMVCDEFIEMLIEYNKMECPIPITEKGFMSTSLLKTIAKQNEPYAARNNILKIYVPADTIGVYVNAVTRRSEEEMLLMPNMSLGLAAYPYNDLEIEKIVYECKLMKSY